MKVIKFYWPNTFFARSKYDIRYGMRTLYSQYDILSNYVRACIVVVAQFMSAREKIGHISFKCQLYSVWRTIKMRDIKKYTRTHTERETILCAITNKHIHTKQQKWTNGLYKIRYSHETNKWFIAFRFNSFPHIFFRSRSFHFCNNQHWQFVSISFDSRHIHIHKRRHSRCHSVWHIFDLQLNYVMRFDSHHL